MQVNKPTMYVQGCRHLLIIYKKPVKLRTVLYVRMPWSRRCASEEMANNIIFSVFP